MPIYRGPQKVTPRRAGVDLARVYRGDRLVWRRIITVTPDPPTFLDDDPWISLPDQEGVTYHVQGTPGAGQSVTVTASAEDGYVLEGTTEWAHTYPWPPRYQASNTGGSGSIIRHDWVTITTHTIGYPAPASGTWSVHWSNLVVGTYGVRVLHNGVQIAETSEVSRLVTPPQTVNIPSRTYNAGDTLTFQARSTVATDSGRSYSSWSWNLS